MNPFREHFDFDPELLFLNSGSLSKTPRSILLSLQSLRTECEWNPTDWIVHSNTRLWETQKSIASFFAANPEDLFLRENITGVMNDLIFGIPLQPEAGIAVTELDYGAVVNSAKLRCELENRPMTQVRLPLTPQEMSEIQPDDLAEHILKQLPEKTGMLIVSHVITMNGWILPIQAIGRAARAAGIHVIVDGAHACGAVQMHATDWSEISAYAGNLNKWMMGPKTTAFGWVRSDLQDELIPREGGWTTYDSPSPVHQFGISSFNRRWAMQGTRDYSSFFALPHVFKLWQKEWGEANIRLHLFELQHRLETEILEKLKWEPASPRHERRAALLSFYLPERLQARGPHLMNELVQKHRLVVLPLVLSNRWLIRFSPHIYNAEAELVRAIEILGNL